MRFKSGALHVYEKPLRRSLFLLIFKGWINLTFRHAQHRRHQQSVFWSYRKDLALISSNKHHLSVTLAPNQREFKTNYLVYTFTHYFLSIILLTFESDLADRNSGEFKTWVPKMVLFYWSQQWGLLPVCPAQTCHEGSRTCDKSPLQILVHWVFSIEATVVNNHSIGEQFQLPASLPGQQGHTSTWANTHY